jgi:hypothetical protein
MPIVMFFILGTIIAWGEQYIVNGETISERLEINAAEYDTIVFRNSRFEEAVIINGNVNLKIIMIFNCNFDNMLSVNDNPAIATLAIATSDFKKHLLIVGNNVEKTAIFNDNIIAGFFQFSRNQVGERCTISNSRTERGFSCFGNIFSSMFQINTTDFSLRSVLNNNRFNEFELNDVSFGALTMYDNHLEKSMGFADCTITAHLNIRRLNDIGDPNSKRSVNFYNTSVYGSVYIENIDTTVLLLNLWQLDFHQDIFIDYDRLISSIGFVTERIVHDPQSIEYIDIKNPYKELSKESVNKFNQLFSNIKSGYEKRGEKDAKINFRKWEYKFKNSFNNPLKRTLKTVLYFASFKLFLSILSAIIFSLVVCIVFMFIYLKKQKQTDEAMFKYLKIDNYQDRDALSCKQRAKNCFMRYFIAFLVSTSVFCSLPMATKKLREDKAKNITWVEGIIGMIMIIIISAIVGRIASI